MESKSVIQSNNLAAFMRFVLMLVERFADMVADRVVAKIRETADLHKTPTGVDNGLNSTTAAAKYLGISPRTLWGLVNNNEITHRRIGKRVLFAQKDLDTYIERKAKRPARY
ncbi:helix-turn-helix domain-containing protein [Oryzomonas rubra]|uniref:DNA-binding protein n=1 Tax=Oryzomonas rubra TaxID=2509454 RepID=A0A5A9XR07_9BACT|nr:helix-turn-helix domain-containing protein [Oryzomonas rubra]KAA0895454.1 DNA-binding protein [Oryzomonas rubra]